MYTWEFCIFKRTIIAAILLVCSGEFWKADPFHERSDAIPYSRE